MIRWDSDDGARAQVDAAEMSASSISAKEYRRRQISQCIRGAIAVDMVCRQGKGACNAACRRLRLSYMVNNAV